MEQSITDFVGVLGNVLLIAGLVAYGFRLFADYHARGRWAKNVTGLLAGVGMLVLAVALAITPQNADLLRKISVTRAPRLLLGVSSALLVAAIAAYGIISFARPIRLRHENQLERDQNRELPKVE
ncbi:MAG TPA: hypothetical protein VMU24_08670 [Candidatus Acidoferrales bacterium]|nr:hypothetical protein [Candidatus Acidoferrales bacterium]